MLSIFLRKIQVCYLCIMNQQMTLLDVMVEHFLPKLVEHFAILVEHYVKTCQKRPFFRPEYTHTLNQILTRAY